MSLVSNAPHVVVERGPHLGGGSKRSEAALALWAGLRGTALRRGLRRGAEACCGFARTRVSRTSRALLLGLDAGGSPGASVHAFCFAATIGYAR